MYLIILELDLTIIMFIYDNIIIVRSNSNNVPNNIRVRPNNNNVIINNNNNVRGSWRTNPNVNNSRPSTNVRSTPVIRNNSSSSSSNRSSSNVSRGGRGKNN